MTCYRNKNPEKNVGQRTKKEFALFFIGKDAYYLYTEDMNVELAKKDALDDLALLEAGVKEGLIEKFEV